MIYVGEKREKIEGEGGMERVESVPETSAEARSIIRI